MSKKKLGKGLGDFFGVDINNPKPGFLVNQNSNKISINITAIDLNPYQPRRFFDEKKISSLARSIKENGLIQPVVVTRNGNKYILIVGERRLRAVSSLGLKKIKAYCVEATEKQIKQMALVENIQRENLNVIEEAFAYKNIKETHHLTDEQIGIKIGKNRSYVTNTIRFLKLPQKVQDLLIQGKIKPTQARPLITIANKPSLLNKVLKTISKKDCSSPQKIEAMIKNLKTGDNITRVKHKWEIQKQLAIDLMKKFNTSVRINDKNIIIRYKNIEHLKTILRILTD